METDRDWQSGKTLQESNRIMLENEIATDVTFVFPGSVEKVKAHQFVLMSRSHVLFVMFNHSLHEPAKDIEIKEIEPAVFRELLKFLYCDEATISAENALHLLYSAQKYEVEILKAKCLEFLQTNLDVNTVGLILDQAVFYGEDNLYRTCLDFLSNHSIRSLKRLNDYHVSWDTLEVIVECESLWADEVFIVRACDTWATEECKKLEMEVCAENKRKVLGSILTKIRFCSMTNDEIASTVSPTGLLSVQEEVAVFRYIGAPDANKAPFPCAERLPLHAMLPPELTKDPGRSMRQFFHVTNEVFHVVISCCQEFKLLGFFFTETGTFNIRLNDSIEEEFIVAQADVNMYLPKPHVCDANNSLDIRHRDVDQKAHIRNETQSFTCKGRINRTDNCLVTYNVTRYDLIPPPFNALILLI